MVDMRYIELVPPGYKPTNITGGTTVVLFVLSLVSHLEGLKNPQSDGPMAGSQPYSAATTTGIVRNEAIIRMLWTTSWVISPWDLFFFSNIFVLSDRLHRDRFSNIFFFETWQYHGALLGNPMKSISTSWVQRHRWTKHGDAGCWENIQKFGRLMENWSAMRIQTTTVLTCCKASVSTTLFIPPKTSRVRIITQKITMHAHFGMAPAPMKPIAKPIKWSHGYWFNACDEEKPSRIMGLENHY